MKKPIIAVLMAAAVLNPVASLAGSHKAPRDKHHTASIHFTKNKTKEAVIGGEIAIGAAAIGTAALLDSTTVVESDAWWKAHPMEELQHNSLINALQKDGILTDLESQLSIESLNATLFEKQRELTMAMGASMDETVSEFERQALQEKMQILNSDISNLKNLINFRTPYLAASRNYANTKVLSLGSGVTIGTTVGVSHVARAQTLDKLHAKDGKTIHYRYDGKKSDKEIRTEIKQWLQEKSYLKGVKIKTDKFDHGTHTYTYYAGDTWITVKL